MIVGSDSESTEHEKDRPEFNIESDELMVEIDDFVLLFEDCVVLVVVKFQIWNAVTFQIKLLILIF